MVSVALRDHHQVLSGCRHVGLTTAAVDGGWVDGS